MSHMNVDSEIHLELLNESHANDLFLLVDSDREYLSQWLAFPPTTKTVDDIRTFIQSSTEGFSQDQTMVCTIQYHKTMVGIISFNKILKPLKKVEIGYWLGSKYQGKGIVTRACRTMIDHAFNNLGMEKVELFVAVENTSSRKIGERLGFELEGIITNCESLHGIILDHALYALHKAKAPSA